MKIFQKGLLWAENKIHNPEARLLAGIFFYCMLALSLWSNFLITKVLHCPFFLYEIYFILPAALYLRKNGFGFLKKIPKTFFEAGIVFVVFLCIGLLRNPEHFMSQITTYRVWFYFLVIIGLCLKNDMPELNRIYAAVLGAVTGDMLFCLISPNHWDITPLNLIALAAAVCLPLVQSNYIALVFSMAICTVSAFLSGFRISFVVILVAYFAGLLFSVICTRKKKNFILLGITVCGGILFVLFFDDVAGFLQNVFHINSYAFFRVTERLKALFRFDFVASQDGVRLSGFRKPFDYFSTRVIPRGLIGKTDGSYGEYKDVPILFLYDSFGAVYAWFITAFMGSVGAWNLYNSYKTKNSPALGFIGAMFPVIVLFFLLNGCFLMDTYEVCITAVVLGYWLKYFFGASPKSGELRGKN